MVRSGGRPPWERGAAGVGGDAETGGSDVGGENRVLANGALGEFIDMCIPVGGRRVFTPDSTCKCNGWFRVGLF